MRYVLNEFLEAYDAFDKYGYGDGDHPLADDARYRVIAVLAEIGWGYEEARSIHNNRICGLTSPDGTVYDLEWTLDLEAGQIREEMYRREFPRELLKALDELNDEVIDNLDY